MLGWQDDHRSSSRWGRAAIFFIFAAISNKRKGKFAVKVVDGRGLECPKPVILTKQAVDGGASELEVLVDNTVAVGNVTRFLNGAGFSVEKKDESKGDERSFRLCGKKSSDVVAESSIKDSESIAFLITSDKIGADSDGLGEVLIKGWLGTIKARTPLPSAIALMNEGVKLALPGAAADVLKEMEDAGVRILVCGTCTKHFGITEKIAVGVISNMFEITEAVYGASKPVVVA